MLGFTDNICNKMMKMKAAAAAATTTTATMMIPAMIHHGVRLRGSRKEGREGGKGKEVSEEDTGGRIGRHAGRCTRVHKHCLADGLWAF